MDLKCRITLREHIRLQWKFLLSYFFSYGTLTSSTAAQLKSADVTGKENVTGRKPTCPWGPLYDGEVLLHGGSQGLCLLWIQHGLPLQVPPVCNTDPIPLVGQSDLPQSCKRTTPISHFAQVLSTVAL